MKALGVIQSHQQDIMYMSLPSNATWLVLVITQRGFYCISLKDSVNLTTDWSKAAFLCHLETLWDETRSETLTLTQLYWPARLNVLAKMYVFKKKKNITFVIFFFFPYEFLALSSNVRETHGKPNEDSDFYEFFFFRVTVCRWTLWHVSCLPCWWLCGFGSTSTPVRPVPSSDMWWQLCWASTWPSSASGGESRSSVVAITVLLHPTPASSPLPSFLPSFLPPSKYVPAVLCSSHCFQADSGTD